MAFIAENFGCGITSASARKIFRPLPSYFVPSLVLSKSKRNVGSRLRSVLTGLLPRLIFVEFVVGATGKDNAEGGIEAADEVPPELKSHCARSPTATTISTTAMISLFRFSLPIFILKI